MTNKKIVLVTGANGFVGRHLMRRLSAEATYLPVAATRNTSTTLADHQSVVVGNIDGNTNWQKTLQKINIVVHTAARVHVMDEQASDPLAEFRRVNVQGTLRLAQQAAQSGVGRFVYLSSIKVLGEVTLAGQPFTEESLTQPADAYGISKLEAEQGLFDLAAQTGMEVVIVRPPLIYGLGVKANFAALMRAVQSGIPLPLGAIHNARSMVGLDNLVDFIVTCLAHPKAANQAFMVSDGHDLSTTALIRAMALSAGVTARLLPAPVWTLKASARLLGKSDAMQRICANLQVDITKARRLLDWKPSVTVAEGLRLSIKTGK